MFPGVIAAWVSVAAAGAVPPPIVSGTETEDHPAVGVLLACTDVGCGVICGGTLIHPSWVLTAAHCAADVVESSEAFSFIFALGSAPVEETGREAQAEVGLAVPHPDFDVDTLANDVGLLELASPIDDVAVMVLNDDGIRDSWLDDDLRYVGFGATDDEASADGRKRYADIPLYTYDDTILYAWSREEGRNICSGDSGGPALDSREGTWRQAGVNSFVWSPDGDDTPCEGGANGALRVDAYLDWIRGYCDVEVLVELDTGPETVDTGDTGGGGGVHWQNDDGCQGCQAHGASQHTAAFLLLSVGGLALRRRKKQIEAKTPSSQPHSGR